MSTTSILRRGWAGLTALWALTQMAQAGTFKTITIDGSFGDWAGVPVAYEDPADSTDSADYRRIYVANDADYLYLRFTLERPANPFLATANIFLDTDASVDSGFRVIVGSEMLIQGGSGYDERNGGFNEGAVNGLGWLSAPAGEATEFELRIARSATFAIDNAPVFTGETIAFVLEAEDANFGRKETAPDSEGIVYSLAAPPPTLTSPLALIRFADTTWRFNDANTDLGTAWREPGFDDSTPGWKSGTPFFGYSPTPGAYPRPIATPLATSPGTVYLRTKFQWDANPANLVFAVSNYLSDGAVIYLNGAEVRRIRLTSDPVTFATRATRSADPVGKLEIFGIPGGPLVSGENVLAVELHQSTDSPADLVFGLSLTATPDYPARIVENGEPADRSVVAGTATTFNAEVLGTAPLTYQWRRNGSPITGANGPSFTLDPVLKSDEGRYSLRVSNPGGTVDSREAELTVTIIPAAITDAGKPADLTLLEGAKATFEVVVGGSPPITFQWLKNGFPITGATEASYTIPAVTPDDAGDYMVQVSNPATPSLLSRTARLVVQTDRIAPSLVSVVGSPNKVTVTFSEAVDPVSATDKSHYSLSDGLTVNSASVISADPAVVVLTTSPQTLLTAYSLTVTGVKDLFANVILPASKGTFRSTIVVDGAFDDWAGVAIAASDPSEPPAAGTDFKDIWVTNDEHYLYLRFTLHSPGDPGTYLNNIFLDTNPLNPGFSTSGIGSEMLIQQGAGYQQKNGAFNEGGISGLDFAMVPAGAGVDFELRISRAAKYESDKLPVFVDAAVRFFLETENTSFVTTDTAPDSGGFEYTFVPLTPLEIGPLVITRAADKLVITWSGAGKLQSRNSLSVGAEWVDVPDAASGMQVTPSDEARFYRLIL